jgi:uncharacterized membrane protein (GlpM family)
MSMVWKLALGALIVGVIAVNAKDVVRYIRIATM